MCIASRYSKKKIVCLVSWTVNETNFQKNAQTADLPTLEKGMTLKSTSNSMKNRLDHMRGHGKIFLPMQRRCQNCYLPNLLA